MRSAVDAANANPGSNTIEFDPAVFNGDPTVTLAGSQLELTNSVNIQGPVGGMTISANNQFTVFLVVAGVTANLSDLSITGGNAAGNRSANGGNGGGIYNNGALTLSSCTVSFNTANLAFHGSGGGLFNLGTATLFNCHVTNNTAWYGGGLHNGATATLSDCTVANNSATYGGGLDNFGGTATVSDCTVANNSATYGGGLNNFSESTATVSDCTVANNSASIDGGGLNNGGILTLSTCTVYSNGATGPGGGIFNEEFAQLTLIGSTLSGYTANGVGGGLDNLGVATLLDCTVAANGASRGGGIDNENNLTLTNCTVADNIATGFANAGGGGIASDGNPVILANTIVAGDRNRLDGPHHVARLINANFCLIETIGPQFSLSSFDNITGQDPLLAPLGNYGGPTPDHAAAARFARSRPGLRRAGRGCQRQPTGHRPA